MLARLTYASFMRSASSLSGVAAMLAATASFVLGDSFMKLAAEDRPPFEALALRGVAATLVCAILVALRASGAIFPAPSTAARCFGRRRRRSAFSALDKWVPDFAER
jgi:drug/metabolite transporter (DMT)-like permease